MEAFPASTMPSLPVEMTLAILEILQTEDDGKQGLLAFRLTSKDFATLAASPLFRTLNLSRKSGTDASVISLLKERPDLAALVKEINFDVKHTQHGEEEENEDREYEDDGEEDDEDGKKSLGSMLKRSYQYFGRLVDNRTSMNQSVSIFSRLYLFPALETLRLRFPSSYEDCDVGLSDSDDDGEADNSAIFMTDARTLQIKILTELANFSAKPNAPNTIRTFELHGLITQPNEGARLDSLKIFLRGIRNLSLSTVANSKQRAVLPGSNGWRNFWTKDIISFLTAPVALTSFELITDFSGGTVGPRCAVWDSMNWPNLRSLSLGGMIFNDSFKYESTQKDPLSIVGVEAFILRHPSLVQLDLQNCFLSFDMHELPSPRMWADVLKGFEDKLVNLEKFTLYPIPCRPYNDNNPDIDDNGKYDNSGEGYVQPTMFVDYDNFFHNDETPPRQDVDLDSLALESLHVVVAGRLRSSSY